MTAHSLPAGAVLSSTLSILQRHPAYLLANLVAAYLGIGRDWITFAETLSLAAGRMAIPVNLDIVTDQWTVDLAIADRLAAILPGTVASIDTYSQFSAEEQNQFQERYVLLVRRDFPRLFHDVSGFAARAADSFEHAPSLWRITPSYREPAVATATLRLLSSVSDRPLRDFASAFASRAGDVASRQQLAEIIESLCPRMSYPCPFRQEIYAASDTGVRRRLLPVNMLVVERLMQIFANLRRVLSDHRDVPRITGHDYGAVRALLIHLPLVPVDRVLSAETLATAESIYDQVQIDSYQLALPDRNSEGHKWFTRNHAVAWTGLGYTTIKKQLAELEDDGLLTSTVDRNNRHHGRVIHYRFASGRSPPFGWRNPFEELPELMTE